MWSKLKGKRRYKPTRDQKTLDEANGHFNELQDTADPAQQQMDAGRAKAIAQKIIDLNDTIEGGKLLSDNDIKYLKDLLKDDGPGRQLTSSPMGRRISSKIFLALRNLDLTRDNVIALEAVLLLLGGYYVAAKELPENNAVRCLAMGLSSILFFKYGALLENFINAQESEVDGWQQRWRGGAGEVGERSQYKYTDKMLGKNSVFRAFDRARAARTTVKSLTTLWKDGNSHDVFDSEYDKRIYLKLKYVTINFLTDDHPEEKRKANYMLQMKALWYSFTEIGEEAARICNESLPFYVLKHYPIILPPGGEVTIKKNLKSLRGLKLDNRCFETDVESYSLALATIVTRYYDEEPGRTGDVIDFSTIKPAFLGTPEELENYVAKMLSLNMVDKVNPLTWGLEQFTVVPSDTVLTALEELDFGGLMGDERKTQNVKLDFSLSGEEDMLSAFLKVLFEVCKRKI